MVEKIDEEKKSRLCMSDNVPFERNLDKSNIPVCNILGVNVAAINMEWLINYISNNVCELSGDYICVANVHTTVTAFEKPEYLEIQNGGIMAIPDGGPLSTLGKKRGHFKMERTAGPTLMDEIFKISVEHGYRHFFYGSTEETLEKMYKNLKKKYPGIEVIGMCSPPFFSTVREDTVAIKQINKVNPDYVWIGLGAPKQEEWMAIHQGKITGLMIGVGAGFDYFAGNIRRAPKWMQNGNIEWMYRLLQDPRRLFRRYWHTNIRFIWNAVIKGK